MNYEELSKKHFDEQAAVYDETETLYYSKYPKISCNDVMLRLKNVSFGKFLDVGCGTGFLINLLRKEHKANYYGLDISPEMLKVAGKKLGDSVYLTEGSASVLPYDSGTMDIVTCIQSFHHYPEPEKAMSEAFRVLAPGGMYILSDSGTSSKFGQWIDNRILFKLMKSGDYAAYGRKDIENLMKQAGFEITVSEKVKGMVYTVIGVKPH